jgi:hypothetical protein
LAGQVGNSRNCFNQRVNGFAVTATRAVGFFGRAVGENDRDGFIGLKVKDNRLIGPFKEGSDPIFSGYEAFLAVFGFVVGVVNIVGVNGLLVHANLLGYGLGCGCRTRPRGQIVLSVTNRWSWSGFVVGFVTVVGRQVAIGLPMVASPTPVLVALRA